MTNYSDILNGTISLIKNSSGGDISVYTEVDSFLINNLLKHVDINLNQPHKVPGDVLFIKVRRFILDLEDSTREDNFSFYQIIEVNNTKYELNALILQKSTRGASTTHYTLIIKDRFRWVKIDDTIKQLNGLRVNQSRYGPSVSY